MLTYQLKFKSLVSQKKQQTFDNVVSISSQALESQCIDCNENFLAYMYKPIIGHGTNLAVLDNSKPINLTQEFPCIRAHDSPMTDFQFDQKNYNQIATCSEDKSIKIWQVPQDGITKDISQPLINFIGHTNKIILVRYNPAANNLISSVSFDKTLKLWDLQRKSLINSINIQDNPVWMTYDYEGKIVATICKDKQLRMIDQRQQSIVQQISLHQGPKSQRLVFFGNTQYALSTGFNKSVEREYFLLDKRKLEQPVLVEKYQNVAATLWPHFDHNSNILFLGGKGEGNIKYYEWVNSQLIYKNENKSMSNNKGFCFLPKHAIDVSLTEINRVFKLTDKNIETVSFIIPRKTNEFSEELFPDVEDQACVVKSDEWLAGQNTQWQFKSMDPKKKGQSPIKVVQQETSISPQKEQSPVKQNLLEEQKQEEVEVDQTEQYIEECLKKNPIFSGMQQSQINKIKQNWEICKYKNGDVLQETDSQIENGFLLIHGYGIITNKAEQIQTFQQYALGIDLDNFIKNKASSVKLSMKEDSTLIKLKKLDLFDIFRNNLELLIDFAHKTVIK